MAKQKIKTEELSDRQLLEFQVHKSEKDSSFFSKVMISVAASIIVVIIVGAYTIIMNSASKGDIQNLEDKMITKESHYNIVTQINSGAEKIDHNYKLLNDQFEHNEEERVSFYKVYPLIRTTRNFIGRETEMISRLDWRPYTYLMCDLSCDCQNNRFTKLQIKVLCQQWKQQDSLKQHQE